MKYLATIVLGISACTCFPQYSSTLLLSNVNVKKDVNSCYKATPALVVHANPDQLIFQSTDGGTTWIDMSKGLPEKINISNMYANNNQVYMGTREGQLFCTNDIQNPVWELQQFEGKIKPDFIMGFFEGKSGTYVCTQPEGFYRQVPGTNRWKPMHENLKDAKIFAVLELPGGALMIGSGTGIYLTNDDGKTWKNLYDDGWINALSYHSNVILANSGKGILRSADNGTHWCCVIEDVGGLYDISTVDGYFVAFRETGSWGNDTKQQFVKISTDGIIWQHMDTGNPSDTYINDIEKMGDYLYTSRKAGVSRSNDMGKTWQLLITPPDPANDMMMFELISSGSNLFAFIRQGGC